MKQIKIFKENVTEKTINSFLKKTNGDIVNYNPIIIEWEIIDEIILPSITCKGVSTETTFSADNMGYDTPMDSITVRYNSVLFFGDKIVFLNNLTEVLEIYPAKDNLNRTYYVVYNYNNEIRLIVDRIDYEPYYEGNLLSYLEGTQIYPVENFIGYNRRTQALERIGNGVVESNNKISESNIESANIMAGALNNIANTNKQIHNGKMHSKIII
jgi:hypothetical protein|tara:strand:- start:4878 stop:5516 length:639 start_codon:yes stop_codon:yes gene_type:complete